MDADAPVEREGDVGIDDVSSLNVENPLKYQDEQQLIQEIFDDDEYEETGSWPRLRSVFLSSTVTGDVKKDIGDTTSSKAIVQAELDSDEQENINQVY